MKNITLSIPEDLLKQSRNYAKFHNTTLNDLVRKLLSDHIKRQSAEVVEKLFTAMDGVVLKKNDHWTREELHER